MATRGRQDFTRKKFAVASDPRAVWYHLGLFKPGALPRWGSQALQVVECSGFDFVATGGYHPSPGIDRFPQLSEVHVEFSDFPTL